MFQPYILTETVRWQVENFITECGLSLGCKEFLRNINFRRNPKYGSLVFAKVRTFAAVLAKSPRTIRRYIREAEDAGFLIIEERVLVRPRVKACSLANMYYFTTLLADKNNAILKAEILALPTRRFKFEGQKRFDITKFGEIREATIIGNDKQFTPPPHVRNDIQELSNLKSISYNILSLSNCNTVWRPPDRKRGREGDKMIKNYTDNQERNRTLEVDKILEAYDSVFGPATINQRDSFKLEYLRSKSTMPELLNAIKKLSSDETLKETTKSPARLFFANVATSYRSQPSRSYENANKFNAVPQRMRRFRDPTPEEIVQAIKDAEDWEIEFESLPCKRGA